MPGAYLRGKALEFRKELSMPLIMLGGINNMTTMGEDRDDRFEFVAMARALLRKPAWINRIQAGETDRDICNQCMPTIYSGLDARPANN